MIRQDEKAPSTAKSSRYGALTYQHSMACHTEGIRAQPPSWRSMDGSVGVFWDAEAVAGATGYYLSPDPRLVIFFNDVSSQIRITNQDGGFGRDGRQMARAIYVPAGTPLWTRFTAQHRFTHLDLHLHKDRLLRYLAPSLGRSTALAALRKPVELQDTQRVEPLASLLVDEIARPSRHPLHAESLVGSLVTGLLDLTVGEDSDPAGGRLTQAQMNKLNRHVEAHDGRLHVADMASVVGLSESWFAHVFKQTTGRTPLQWLQARRIHQAQALLLGGTLTLAEVAVQLGFCDQAHLTKAFRQVSGETPAAWRRRQRLG